MAEKPSSRSDRDVPAWLAYLPQSADDRTMQQKVKQLFDQVELHVDNYYHKANVDIDKETSQALSRIDSGKLPVPITDLIRNQRMAPSVIKHCIANLLVTRITPGKDPNRSLLPSWLAVQPAKLIASNSPKENSGTSSRIERSVMK